MELLNPEVIRELGGLWAVILLGVVSLVLFMIRRFTSLRADMAEIRTKAEAEAQQAKVELEQLSRRTEIELRRAGEEAALKAQQTVSDVMVKLMSENIELRKTISEIELKLREVMESAGKTEVRYLNQLSAQREQHIRELNEVRTKLDSVESQLADMKFLQDDTSRRRAEAEMALKAERALRETAEKELEQAREQLQDQKAEIIRLQAQIDELRLQVDQLLKDHREIQELKDVAA